MRHRFPAILLGLGLFVLAAPALAAGASSSSTTAAQPTAYKQAVKAVEAGDYAQALTLLEEIVRGDPDNADAWNYVGYSQRKLQRYAEAEESYKTALKIEPEHTGALEYLGELYLETDRPELARAQLQKLDKACFFGCEAYDELKEAIDSFEKHRQSS